MRLNKKPPKPYASYIGNATYWFMGGMLFTFMLALISALISGDIISGKWSLVIILILLILTEAWFVYNAYSYDRKVGIYKAINDVSVEYWHKKRKEYGLESEVNNG
jgi:cytochrome c biogenesis protein CcdA